MNKFFSIEEDESGNIINLYARPQADKPKLKRIKETDKRIVDFKASRVLKAQQGQLISDRISKTKTDQAIAELKAEGVLPTEYKQ